MLEVITIPMFISNLSLVLRDFCFWQLEKLVDKIIYAFSEYIIFYIASIYIYMIMAVKFWCVIVFV